MKKLMKNTVIALGTITLVWGVVGCVSMNASKMLVDMQVYIEKLNVLPEELDAPIPADSPLVNAVAVGRVKDAHPTDSSNSDGMLRGVLLGSLGKTGYCAQLNGEDYYVYIHKHGESDFESRYTIDAVILELESSGTIGAQGRAVVDYTLKETKGGAVVFRKTITASANGNGPNMSAMKDNFAKWNALRETIRLFLSDITAAVSAPR